MNNVEIESEIFPEKSDHLYMLKIGGIHGNAKGIQLFTYKSFVIHYLSFFSLGMVSGLWIRVKLVDFTSYKKTSGTFYFYYTSEVVKNTKACV